MSLLFLKRYCLGHKLTIQQFPQKPAAELFVAFFVPVSKALEPLDTNMFGPVVFITVPNKQAADLLPHACRSWLINTDSITHTLWQLTPDSSNIFRLNKHLDQPESRRQLCTVLSIQMQSVL